MKTAPPAIRPISVCNGRTARVSAIAIAAVAAVLVGFEGGPAAAAPVRSEPVAEHLMAITRQSVWRRVAAVPLRFRTFHPQGLVKIGADFYLSSVEVLEPPRPSAGGPGGRDAGAGTGHLFRFGADGALKTDLRLGDGAIYHPGGIDFDGGSIWVPVSEYRPDSRAIVYSVDPETMAGKVAFRVDDHIGAVACDRGRRELHGFSWGSRRSYRWRLSARRDDAPVQASPATPNRFHYIDYQDCHGLGLGRMVCGGLADYPVGDSGGRFQLGGLELVDMRSGHPLWQAPVPMRSPAGRTMTQNPVFVEATATGVRAYFVPDDDVSTLYVYEVDAGGR